MSTALPARITPRNTAASVASPAFVVLASRPTGPDGAEIILRDTIVAKPEDVRAFAVRMLQAIADRHPTADVQVFAPDGVFVFSCGNIERAR